MSAALGEPRFSKRKEPKEDIPNTTDGVNKC